jgi:radical SAM superfamily enzyme YgiQ (UPF0313 family)
MFQFCESIKKLGIQWDCQGRVNLADRDILRAMKDAGCVCIGFGIESGSQKILDNMNKQIKVEQIRNALILCKELRLPVKVQLIYAYPGENDKTLTETINLFKELRYPARRLGIITPLPGALLYEHAKKDGFIGDGEKDVISEENYLKYLSLHGGWCTKDLFYNRSDFSDEQFIKKLEDANIKMLKNFFKEIVLHPTDLIKYWNVYKFYIRNWWYHRANIKLLKYLTVYPVLTVKNPRHALKTLKDRLTIKHDTSKSR